MRHMASSRAAAVALTAVTGLFLLCAADFTFHLSGGLTDFLNDWVYDNVMLAAGAVCIARGIIRRGDRLAWILIGTAVAAWGIGDTVWSLTIANDPSPPAPSVADIGFLAVYPLAYAAILLLLRSRAGTLRGSLWLDGVIGGLAVAALGTAVVFQAIMDTIGGSPAAVATNLAYPLADVTLIALVVWSLAVTGWRPDRTWAFLASGLLVFSISDCLYLYDTATDSYVEGGVTDLGWLAGGLLLAWAAWQPRRERAAAKLDGWGLLFAPVGFGLGALGVLVYDHVRREHGDDRPLTTRGPHRRDHGPRQPATPVRRSGRRASGAERRSRAGALRSQRLQALQRLVRASRRRRAARAARREPRPVRHGSWTRVPDGR